jgi:hypothetical protein
MCNGTKSFVGYVYDGNQSRQTILHEATFVAVSVSGGDENKAFFAATPTGTLTVGTHHGPIFEAGKEYYLDISPAIAE